MSDFSLLASRYWFLATRSWRLAFRLELSQKQEASDQRPVIGNLWCL